MQRSLFAFGSIHDGFFARFQIFGRNISPLVRPYSSEEVDQVVFYFTYAPNHFVDYSLSVYDPFVRLAIQVRLTNIELGDLRKTYTFINEDGPLNGSLHFFFRGFFFEIKDFIQLKEITDRSS